MPARLPRHPAVEDAGDLLERLVLQQPREQQVPRLEQREVLLVLDVALRQQPGGLQVEQRRGDEQEGRGLLEVPRSLLARPLASLDRPVPGLDVRDELVGDLGQRHLGDVELVLADQAQQQVEGTLEVRQVQGEARTGRGLLGTRDVLVGRDRQVRHRSVSRCTSALSSPLASRSASAIAIASRTSRPRSTASPW